MRYKYTISLLIYKLKKYICKVNLNILLWLKHEKLAEMQKLGNLSQ